MRIDIIVGEVHFAKLELILIIAAVRIPGKFICEVFLICRAVSSDQELSCAFPVCQLDGSGEFGFGVSQDFILHLAYQNFVTQYIVSEREHTADPDMNWVVKVVALGQLTF